DTTALPAAGEVVDGDGACLEGNELIGVEDRAGVRRDVVAAARVDADGDRAQPAVRRGVGHGDGGAERAARDGDVARQLRVDDNVLGPPDAVDVDAGDVERGLPGDGQVVG